MADAGFESVRECVTSDRSTPQHSAFEEVRARLEARDAEVDAVWGESQIEARSAAAVSAASAGDIVVVAEGDSWFDYPFNDVVDCLDGRGFDVHSDARRGHLLEDMAHTQLDGVVRLIRRRRPRFLLLSGGGNDIAGAELAMLVNHRESRLARRGERLRSDVVDYVFERVFRDAYRRVIETCSDAARDAGVERFDILGHGYAHPFADGRPAYWIFGPWLRPALERRGYHDENERNELVRDLIDRMNALQESLAAEYGHFHHLDLRPHLNRRRDWADELHPTQRKFAELALVFRDAMYALLP